jgi:hypothetical protein
MGKGGTRRLSGSGLLLVIATAAVAVALLVDFIWGAQLGWYPPADGQPTTAPPTTTDRFANGIPHILDDPNEAATSVEGYWYCWNNGPLMPHHLGHRMPNDHLCTWGELRSSGFAD